MFDGITVSPLDNLEGSKARRLASERRLVYKEDAKIFGVTMPDAMWWGSGSARSNALAWEILLIAAVAGTAGWLVVRYIRNGSVYIPENGEIKLNINNPESYRI